MSIKFFTDVVKVERKQARRYQPGTWTSAKGEVQVEYQMVDLGYYLHLRGSHEALYIGEEEPEFHVGDRVSVTIRPEP